jgi:hypothetical protein
MCLSCSREICSDYQFCFPLRLVFGVSYFAVELILRKRSSMQRSPEESEGFGRRFQRALVLSECIYFAI